MKSYTIEFPDGGVTEGQFANSIEAIGWVETVLESRGFDRSEIENGRWEADGENDDGERCYRMLFWANAESSINDNGANSICQVCMVGAKKGDVESCLRLH